MPTKIDPFVENLSQLKQTSPVQAEETTTYSEVLKLLHDRRVGSVILCREGKVTGIFTERDILNRTLLEDIPPTTPISELMTSKPTTIHESATIGEAIAVMHRKHVRNLPIVDAEDRLIGLLTVGRLIRLIASAFPAAVVNLPPKPSQVSEQAEGA